MMHNVIMNFDNYDLKVLRLTFKLVQSINSIFISETS